MAGTTLSVGLSCPRVAGGCPILRTQADLEEIFVATNKGGSRKGAVRNRFQLLDPESNLWSIFSTAGEYLRTKKSPGPYKGVKVGPPKRKK